LGDLGGGRRGIGLTHKELKVITERIEEIEEYTHTFKEHNKNNLCCMREGWMDKCNV
jgi:hypothetical protein